MKKTPNDDNFEKLANRSITDIPVEIVLPVEPVSGLQDAWGNSFSITSPTQFTQSGNRAWWALGQFWLAVGNDEAAIVCAKAGLEELGDDYAHPMAIDDTQMKLWVAQERIRKGHLSDGADMMLRILESRLHLYDEQQKHNLKIHT